VVVGGQQETVQVRVLVVLVAVVQLVLLVRQIRAVAVATVLLAVREL
jgi:hypothetical protein